MAMTTIPFSFLSKRVGTKWLSSYCDCHAWIATIQMDDLLTTTTAAVPVVVVVV